MCKTSIDLSSVCRHFGAISVCIIIIIIIWLGNQSQRENFIGSVVFMLLLLLGWWLYHFIFVWSWNWIDCAGGGGSAIFWYLALVLLLLCGSGQNREFSTYPNDIHSRKQATKAGRKNASKRGEEKYKSRWRPTERTWRRKEKEEKKRINDWN